MTTTAGNTCCGEERKPRAIVLQRRPRVGFIAALMFSSSILALVWAFARIGACAAVGAPTAAQDFAAAAAPP
jgi:hypothetical protein